MMKAIGEYLTRLRAAQSAQAVTEADVIREVQQDAFRDGYAQAARELFGIALESQERTDAFLTRAADAGVVSNGRLAS